MAGRHYLDHASSVPLRPEAAAAMASWVTAGVGADPGRLHAEAIPGRGALEEARHAVAQFLGARPREVVFTSGGTEACVTATWMALERGRHVVLSAVEHSCVREASLAFADEVTEVGVDRMGRVDVDAVIEAIGPDTALVHLQWANHEVGTRQPVAEVVAACRDRGVLVHVDAAMAAGRTPIAFDDLGADLLSVSAHKLGGPPGVGALLVRRGLRLRPLLVGGAQERARRGGLENIAGAVGFGAVARALADDERLARETADLATHGAGLVDAARSGGLGAGVGLLGDPDPAGRLPGLVCLSIDGVEAEPVLLGLDRAGVAVHSGSSCSSELLEPSPVLEAMGVDASRSLRVSAGWSTTDDDIAAFIGALPQVLGDLRALGNR